ncbi:MAG: long-chain fatty acid--CoA ligase, partial [candidate division Zixibacteria bacterium]|nr:long-chain fatty acid--CoA ligase [candidate division Zixibacteria bacterium]
EFSEEELNSIIKIEITRLCADIADYKRIKSFRLREDEFIKTSTKKIKRYLVVQPSISVNNQGNSES